jgi:O-antigen/teichoic acid export membrane protein
MSDNTALQSRARALVQRGLTLVRSKMGVAVVATLMFQGFTWAMALIVAFYLPSYLGDRNLGKLTLAVGFAASINVLMNFGTSTVLVQDIAKRPETAVAVIRTAIRLRAMTGVGCWVLGALATFALGYEPDVQLIILVILAGSAMSQIADAYQCGLAGLQEFVKVSVTVLCERFTFSVVTIALVFAKAPLWQFAAVYLGAHTVSTLASLTMFRRALPDHPQSEPAVPLRTPRSLATAGTPFVTTKLFNAIYGDGSSALLMSKLSTLESIGWFGLAKRFSGAAQTIPSAIANVAMPRLTRLHTDGDRDGFARLLKKVLAVVFAASAPFSLVLVVFPEWLLRIMHYPAGFTGSIPVLRIAGGALFLWFVQQIVGTALIAAGKVKTFAWVTGIAAAMSVPICGGAIWAGEKFFQNGAAGAMLGDVILEAFMMGCYLYALLPDLFPNRHPGAVAFAGGGSEAGAGVDLKSPPDSVVP